MNAQENIKVSERDSFEKLWKTLQDFETKDLPKSAETVTDIILKKSEKTSDYQNLVKAFMHKAKLRMMVSTDSILVDLKNMENFINSDVVQKGNDVPAKNAIFHVLIASVYQNVLHLRHFYSNQELKSECYSMISQHVDMALKKKELLANVDAKPYEALFEPGDDAKLFNNDVLSLIMYFVDHNNLLSYKDDSQLILIEHLNQTADIYKSLDMKDAYILTQMKIWNLQCNLNSRSKRMSRDEYLNNLYNLCQQSVGLEAGADAFLEYYNNAHFDSKLKRLEILQWAENQWSETVHAKYISHLKKMLYNKNVGVYVDDEIIADQSFKIYVTHANVKSVDVNIRNSENKLVFSQTINDNENAPQEQKTDTLNISLKPGDYVVSVKAEDKESKSEFKVTSLKLVSTILPKNQNVITVLNALTGLPQSHCKVIAGNSKWERGKYITTDSVIVYTDDLGQVFFESNKYSWAYAAIDVNDISTKVSIVKTENFIERDSDEYYEYKIFTDRAIYKPGQTVHVTAYAYVKNGDDFKVLNGHNLKLEAYDANWQSFKTCMLKTDDFGMATDSIVIPKNLLNGQFSVKIGDNVAYFDVEEYKRPTFDIQFEDIEGTMAFGDTVTVTGYAKTYSGVPVQGAKVTIKVENRNADFWTSWRYNFNWNQQMTFETTTDDDGKFAVNVFLDGDRADDVSISEWRRTFNGIMHYRVSAKVTDLAGESHEQQKVFSVSDYEFNLKVDATDNLHQDKLKPFKVIAVNPNGVNVEVNGKWTLQRFEKYHDNTGKYVDTGVEGVFVANNPFEINQLKDLNLGQYRIKVEAQDNRQHKLEAYKSFVLFADREESMTLEDDWIYSPDTYINDSTGINLYYANANDCQFVYAYVISKDNVEWKKIETTDNSLKFLHLDFKDLYKDGVAVCIFYVKNNQLRKLNKSFKYQVPEKKLQMKWTSFRDKLTPGQEETWTLYITDKDGKPVAAQMLATMYDASLDALAENSWDFSLPFYRNCPNFYLNASRAWDSPRAIGLNFPTSFIDHYNRTFNYLIPFNEIGYFITPLRRGIGNVMFSKNVVMNAATMEMEDGTMLYDAAPAAAESSLRELAIEPEEKYEQSPEKPADETVKIRSDFAETAFYYPNLITDQQGNVTISFRLPESLTQWNFMGFAHTTELDYALINATAVAKKDFMVQPNMPRFVRNGDEATISVKIINQAENDIEGKAKMKLINPDDDSIVFEQIINFYVNAGKTQPLNFNFVADDSLDMLICEVTAEGNGFADGERNWLPVLPDKKLITETVPFYIQTGESKDIDIASLFNFNSPTAVNRKMVFQYTDNPSWNVVLAMHAIMNPKDDDAISWAAALYANSALKHLATRIPRLETLIQQWKSENEQETTLQSELEKNQQLKDIVLQEAPWMMDAQNETVNKKQMVELFDHELLDTRINRAIEKLAELQLANGAWTWFKGMEPSYYTTFAVCDNLTRLYEYMKHVGENIQQKVFNMMDNGMSFLDEIELKEFNEYMKKHKKAIPSNTTLHYLYMLAISEHEIKAETRNMVNNYLKRLKGKAKNMTTYGKANIATTLMAFGKNEDALPYIKSIREYLVEKPGMGRFFDGENTYYSWCDYRIPSHVAAMKAFYMAKDFYQGADEYLYDMQIWLLRQKQAQQWNSIVNTINAVDLLLTVSPDSTFYMEEMPEVAFNNHRIEFDRQSAGLGFVKTEIPENVFSETMNSQNKVVHVHKNSPGFSWGTIFAQSFEKLDNMQQNGEELTVERKFYLEQNGEWIPVDDDYTYKVGDKVRIRHIVKADRDMDFVQIRSQHAACLEPMKTHSGYQYLGGRGGYLALHDASADFFFSTFYKGTATIDLDMYVTSPGNYSNGIVTVQCAYAPDFAGHSKGHRIHVE